MRKQIALPLIFFIIYSFAYSQKQQAEIIFKDGRVLKGLAKVTQNREIKFRKSGNSEKQIFKYDEVDTLNLFSDGIKEICVFERTKEGSKYKFAFNVIKEGERCSVYAFKSLGGGPGYVVGPNMSRKNSSKNRVYYLKKKNQKVPVTLGRNAPMNKRWDRNAPIFFSDCKELVLKINTKEVGAKDLLEIVDYYNQCK